MIKNICFAGSALALATTTAFAADLPSRVAPPAFIAPPVVPYSWTGIEFGLTTSYGFSVNGPVTGTGTPGAIAAIAPGSYPASVPMAKAGFDDVGGGVAVNYQFTPGAGFVIGGQVDVSYFDLDKDYTYGGGAPDVTFLHQRLSYLGTVNGRIGYAVDHFLFYGTGGFAFGGVHDSANLVLPGTGSLYAGTLSDTATGYDYGGGIEYAIPKDSFLNYLSVEKLLGIDKTLGLDIFDGTIRAEFYHFNLGGENVLIGNTGATPGSFTSRFRTNGDVIRVGLGYKFSSPAPVVARY